MQIGTQSATLNDKIKENFKLETIPSQLSYILGASVKTTLSVCLWIGMETLVEKLFFFMKNNKLTVKTKSKIYPVYIGNNILGMTGKLIKKKLVMHGRLHIATDWEDYANHIKELGNNDPSLINLSDEKNFSPRPSWRTKTRYESRGERLDHKIWDLCYGLK